MERMKRMDADDRPEVSGVTLDSIMVPLDGSRLAESVLPVAGLLAGCLRAGLVLLHIVEENPPHTVHGEPHLTSATSAEEYLAGVARRLVETSGLSVTTHVHGTQEHDVALSIGLHVAELGADMVAMCTHGRTGLRRVISGSIAQQVLRRVQVPVLLVRPDTPTPARLRTIMVPLDGSSGAEQAVPVARHIAGRCGASLHLVRVVPTVATLTGDAAAAARLAPISTAAALDAEEGQAGGYMGTLAGRLAAEPGHTPTRTEVRRGDVVQNLAEAAAQCQADLIVIATHGRAGLDALWTGSVAAGLMGRVGQPLLLVRIAGHDHPQT